MRDDQDIIQMCCKLLTEHKYLLYILNLESTTDWNLVKQHLLCESTKSFIVVITNKQSVATHCVDHEQDRVFSVQELMKGSHQGDRSGHADGGTNVEEEGTFELHTLVGREVESRFFNKCRAGETWSVWGIAGVGKSALVRQHYSQIKSTQVYRMYVWVDVPDPFNLTDLCQRLLLDLYSDDVDAKEAVTIGMMEGQDPIQRCRKILLEHKCLLVIDGLQSTHDWDLIKASLLPQPILGGTIVITREERVAIYCCPKDNSRTVTCLDADVALDLFKKIIFYGKPLFVSYPEAVAILKLIVSKCGGLPEVIIAIGKRIRRVQQGEFFKTLEHINDDFMGQLQTLSLSEFPSLRGLISWIQSYFAACSDELKPCIFYLSVFPADQGIRWSRLLRRWVAEGYLSGGSVKEAHNLAFQLASLSILHYQGGPTSATSYKLNGFFREYIKSQPMEDNRVFELDGSCSPNPRLTGQHLTVSTSWDRDEIVYKSLDLSRLRSLTVFGEWKSFLIYDKMKVLRVLDLEGTSVTDDDLEQIGKLLPRLKFMSLRGCIQVTRLPDSLGDMKQLETLDVMHTSIVELPPAIVTKLYKLQSIYVGTNQTRPILVTTAPEEMPSRPTLPPPQDVHDGTSPSLRDKERLPGVVQGAWKKMTRDLEESCSIWWQSKNQHRRRRVAANGGGVEVVCTVAERIGELTDLHTLGVVNVAGGKGAFVFLRELKKLTQLRKLWLSGITRGNWNEFCFAISGHHHLESLSLKLLLLENHGSYDFACFDGISKNPKNLTSLEVLYTTSAGAGDAWIRPTWLKQHGGNITLDHDLTISNQEDIDVLFSGDMKVHQKDPVLRIKPIQQHLDFDKMKTSVWVPALRIDCSNISSTVSFGTSTIMAVKELNIHCCSSCGSLCLRIFGLKHIETLKQVLVAGPCSDDFKEDVRQQLQEHPNEPELKLL